MSRGVVLLTGGSGFVGRAILSELMARGIRVVALRHERDVPGASEVISGSLLGTEALTPILREVEAVVHSAALLDPIDDEALANEVNHVATRKLAEAAASSGVRTFVHLSSQAAIGFVSAPGLVRTDAPCMPTTIYGRSKLRAERALRALDPGTMRVVILRPPTVYGPGERRNFLALVRAIDSGWFAVPAGGKNRMSFCAVQNLAHAVAFCVTNETAGGTLHVADEPVMTFRETTTELARALGRRILVPHLPLSVARTLALGLELGFRLSERDPPLTRARLRTLTADCGLDTSETRRIGLRPKVSFLQAIADTIDEYRTAGLLRPR